MFGYRTCNFRVAELGKAIPYGMYDLLRRS